MCVGESGKIWNADYNTLELNPMTMQHIQQSITPHTHTTLVCVCLYIEKTAELKLLHTQYLLVAALRCTFDLQLV